MHCSRDILCPNCGQIYFCSTGIQNRIPRFYFLEYLFQMCSFDVSFFLYHFYNLEHSLVRSRKIDSENYITGMFFVVVRSRMVREPSFEGFGFESNKICSWTKFVQKFFITQKIEIYIFWQIWKDTFSRISPFKYVWLLIKKYVSNIFTPTSQSIFTIRQGHLSGIGYLL